MPRAKVGFERVGTVLEVVDLHRGLIEQRADLRHAHRTRDATGQLHLLLELRNDLVERALRIDVDGLAQDRFEHVSSTFVVRDLAGTSIQLVELFGCASDGCSIPLDELSERVPFAHLTRFELGHVLIERGQDLGGQFEQSVGDRGRGDRLGRQPCRDR